VGLALVLAGMFAIAAGASGRFLPHDERFLGMTAGELCALHGCRIVHFMVHDRVSFGGALLALGLLYLWLAASPLREGRPWAWWVFLITGAVGFASFFAYLGYGYFDAWHGVATLGLLPCYLLGVAGARGTLVPAEGARCLLRPAVPPRWGSTAGLGRLCLLGASGGMAVGGLVILLVGTTCVFVPQDLGYMGLGVEELRSLNPRLVPLIAHDRAGFGGAVCCCGVALFFCTWCGTPSRRLWWVLTLTGAAGFGTAIGVHPAVGYDDPVHLGPAVLGAVVYAAGLALSYRPMAGGAHSARVPGSLTDSIPATEGAHPVRQDGWRPAEAAGARQDPCARRFPPTLSGTTSESAMVSDRDAVKQMTK
jgi:hypothetical protein